MTKTTLEKLPVITKKQIDLLEKLSNAMGVSGGESAVRKIVLEGIKPFASEIKIDALGNILAVCKAARPKAPRVMIAAHMDEVGFMIVDEDEGGFYKFEIVGGLDTRLLPGKAILAGEEGQFGVIGIKPIHLTTDAELGRSPTLENLRIDLGSGNSKGGKVKPGDRAGFATRFLRMGASVSGKAMDNRLGVAALIELVRHAPYHVELIAAFTVQEEIGQRGARVAGYSVHPDAAIALDATPALDFPAVEGEENVIYNTKLGQGPAVYPMDAYTISDPRLIRFVTETAEKHHIPFQIRQPGGGGTDAGAIHKQREGVPSISISIPHRGVHAPVQLARIADWQNTLRLLAVLLNEFSTDLFQTER